MFGVGGGLAVSAPLGDAIMTAWVRTLPIGIVEIGLLGAAAMTATLLPRLAGWAKRLAPLVFVLYLSHAAPLRFLDDTIAARSPGLFGQTWFVILLYVVVTAAGSLMAWAWVRAERRLAKRWAATPG